MIEEQEKDSISLDAFAATIRYHPEGGYGSPYTFVCTLIKLGENGYIQGACGEFNSRVRRLIRKKMLELGITQITFDRIAANGYKRTKVIRKK